MQVSQHINNGTNALGYGMGVFSVTANGIASVVVDEFDLANIAASGQVFTWREISPAPAEFPSKPASAAKPSNNSASSAKSSCNSAPASPTQSSDGSSGRENAQATPRRWLVASGNHVCEVWQQGQTLYLRCIGSGTYSGFDLAKELLYWRHYFALDRNYERILESIDLPGNSHEVAWGTRVLAQNWWDVAVSFVISQNSSIKRIQSTVDALINAAEGKMPGPSQLQELLANDDFARSIKLGYRLPYLRELAAACKDWQPSCLTEPRLPLELQLAELQQLQGVGPKVASCICLFGLEYLQAVPRDTWIKRAERELGIRWDARYGGIQQQYVFAWMRATHTTHSEAHPAATGKLHPAASNKSRPTTSNKPHPTTVAKSQAKY